jgi:hypothetical protein
MARGMRWLVLLMLVAAAPAAAQAPAANQGRLRLGYDIEFTGLTIATLDVDVALGERAYDVNTYVATTGLFGSLYPLTVQARSEGRIIGGQPVAEHHHSETHGRAGTRVIEASYRDGKLIAFQRSVNPPEAEQEPRIPEAERREASDPATAILAVVQGVLSGHGCAQSVTTFDGRRLTVIRFADAGNMVLPRGLVRSFTRPEVSCSFVYQSTDGVMATPPRQGRAWVAHVRPDAMAPLRVELDTRWGTAVVQLRIAPGSTDAGTQPPG